MAVIEINDLSKSYGDVVAVDNISFSVNEGEIFGFIGENGAGKSTTIRVLLNIIFPSSGDCKIFNKDCVLETNEIKKEVGYVPSEVEYYNNMKVNDLFKCTLSFIGSNDYKKVENLCEYFQLDLNKKINELSLGNKKKVSLIQALIRNPKLIILDEPTSGLDPFMQEKLFALLLKKKEEGVSVFLSSHNLEEVERYCDKVAIIKKGKIIDVINIKEFSNKRKFKVKYVIKDHIHECEYEGDINELLQDISKKKIDDIEIKKMSLQEQFMKYYGGDKDE